MKGIKSTNPVAVGDRVSFQIEDGHDTALITDIEERHNYIIRKATKLSKQSHIIAANLDQAILIVTLAMPRTAVGFIDRFLVTAEAYHIPAVIVFNKLDLYNEKQLLKLEELRSIYIDAGYSFLQTSVVTGEGLDLFKEVIQGKTSMLSGHSGVGKSSLINKLEPDLDLKVKELSVAHDKGQHATTYAEMHPLTIGGFIIDTPGIKEFGLIDFEQVEVAERFPEMRRYMHDCRFNNCTHTHEPGCAVKSALGRGEISESRYNSYLRIYVDDAWDTPEWE